MLKQMRYIHTIESLWARHWNIHQAANNGSSSNEDKLQDDNNV